MERGVGRLRAEFGSQPRDLTAAIGPGIGRCCYSVGEEVRMEFTSQFSYADSLFEEVFDLDPIKEKYPMLFLTARAPGHSNLGPSLHLDLVEANRRQLMDAGIAPEKIYALNLCTACDTKRFFSHRAEQGIYGPHGQCRRHPAIAARDRITDQHQFRIQRNDAIAPFGLGLIHRRIAFVQQILNCNRGIMSQICGHSNADGEVIFCRTPLIIGKRGPGP